MADNALSNQTVGKAREVWSEAMFYLALFFGFLHFSTLGAQVYGMVLHTAFGRDIRLSVESSMVLGHVYLAFLAAYVGQKEFVRWLKRADDEVLTTTDAKKITRGIYIVIGWAVFAGLVITLKSLRMVAEVPETLLYTLGEVLALFCGTEASKYLRGRQAFRKSQDSINLGIFGDRIVDHCKVKGSIDNTACQTEFGLSQDQSSRLLSGLAKKGLLKAQGSGPARKYVAA
jgi:hypothetical protein